MKSTVVTNALAITIVLTVVGCATQAQNQAQLMQQNKACKADIKKTDEYHRVSSFMIMDIDDQNAVSKILIDRPATQPEKDDLLKLYKLKSVCRKSLLTNLSTVHPEYVALMRKWYAENDALLVKLLTDEITIGKANEAIKKALADYIEQENSAVARINQRLEASYQSEMASR